MRVHAVAGRRGNSRRWTLRLAGLLAWLALCAGVSDAAWAQDITLERDHYYPGDEVTVHYRFADRAGSQRFVIFGPNGGPADGITIDPRYPNKEKLARTMKVPVEELVREFRGDTFEGVSAQLFYTAPDSSEERLVTEQFLRIVNPVTEARGSLRLNGRRFASGRSIEVGATMPAAGDGETPASGKLVLYKPARRLPGGAILPAVAEPLLDVEGDGTYRITTPTMPGHYELQLRRADDFILDRVPFDIDLELPKVEMSLPGDGPIAMGSSVQVSVAPTFVPWHFDALIFQVLVPNGRGGWKAPNQWNAFQIESSVVNDPRELTPLAQSFEITPEETGPHRLLAYWVYRDLGIEAATLDFDVTVPTDQGPTWGSPSLTLPDGPLFAADQEINVEVGGSAANADSALELQLYKLTPEKVAGPIRLREPLPGPPDMQWDTDAPGMVVMPDDLVPGTYEVYLFDRNFPGARSPMMLAAERFTIVPQSGSAEVLVNGGQPVVAGHRFPVEVKLPEDLDRAGTYLTLQIIYLGGELPGCHPVMESVRYNTELAEGQSTFSISNKEVFSWLPGAYEARLYMSKALLSADYWPNAIVLGARRFEVVYRPQGATLELPGGSQFDENGGDVPVRAKLPDDMQSLLEAGGLQVEVIRLGEHADSGAVRPPLQINYSIMYGQPDTTVSPYRHGAYDLRLEMREAICLLDTCRSPVLDRQRIDITSKTWRGPATLLPHDPGPDGMKVAAGLQDFPPIGPRGSCGRRDWVPPPDVAIEPRIVVLHDGKFVPFDGALSFGQPFAVEGRLKDPALHPVYRLELADGQDQPFDVLLYPTDNNPRLLRSKLLYMMWDVTAADAQSGSSDAQGVPQ